MGVVNFSGLGLWLELNVGLGLGLGLGLGAAGPTGSTSRRARVSEPTRVTRPTNPRLLANPTYLFIAVAVTSLFSHYLLLSSLYIFCSRWPPKRGHDVAEVIQNRPFIRVSRYGHFRTEWTSQKDFIYPDSQTAGFVIFLRKIM